MTLGAKKLIEVALPLEAINEASAREKNIRHGHPSTLHLWWARRPLAAARAVIFAQMVDDPSARPDLFPTEKAQEKERKRLFKIIEDLVKWENTTNETVLQAAREEIWQSWRRACAENADHPRAKELFDRNKLPAFHDPFAGGGALPLEAQRLGLESYASDLNPVAVLINKAMIEIPPKFAGRPPVNPESRKKKDLVGRVWKGAEGLAEDVRYYGQWMRDEAEKRIGKLYPPVEVTAEMANGRPDLKPYVGRKLTVIAWLWARTVKSPNPAFAEIDVPLASTFMLSTKEGKEAYVQPVIEDGGYRFTVNVGRPKDVEKLRNGTRAGKAQDFVCLLSGVPIPRAYIRDEGKAGRLGARLMAIVAEGDKGRVFLSPSALHEQVAHTAGVVIAVDEARATFLSVSTPTRAMITGGVCSAYGLTTFGDLFTARQLAALTTFSDLVSQVRGRVEQDARAAVLPERVSAFREGALGTRAYADAVSVYLALAIDRMANTLCSIARWTPERQQTVTVFARQAIPMTWDYPDVNPFAGAAGDYAVSVDGVIKGMPTTVEPPGLAEQADAADQSISRDKMVSTDPPYYDNVGYADLSDFFYVWLRRSLRPIFPELFATMSAPKAQELTATPFRHGSQEKADSFFLAGMTRAMNRLADEAHPAFPVTIYYAFKQAESDDEAGTASTGWDTFLEAVLRAGFAISGTWPVRTELSNRMIGSGTNALASSIVLVCRKRLPAASAATRRDFLNALKSELPAALVHLQRGNIAPVDLAQAAIGPGMAVFTRYAQVLDAEGKPMSVRQALALINQTLDEALAEQEGDFDADTRWALAWFEQHGFEDGEFGTADVLARAKVTAVNGLVDAGIVRAGRGKVRLLKPDELPKVWNPTTDARLTAWECVHQLIRAQDQGGDAGASELVAKLGAQAETARELAYRLYTLCERKRRAEDARAYNALVQSWPEFVRLAQERPAPAAQQSLI